MADDRRIIFSSYIVPKEAADAEEAIPQKWSILRQDSSTTAVAKTLGGKGIVTDINATQWGDGWTSMFHENAFWEDQDELWGASMDHWDGTAGISGTPYQLTLADAEAVNQPLSFCYIKNTGDIELQVSHTGTGGNYIMRIPAGGSAGWRGGQTSENFYADDVWVKSGGSSTTIEFIIAIK